MWAGIAGAWPLVLAALAMLALTTLLAWHWTWRARVRRRTRPCETGLQLALDACAPEGGIVSYDEFPAVRLRGESLAPTDYRRS